MDIINITFINIIFIVIIINNIINNGINIIDININFYKLNKLNVKKPDFIKDKKIIIKYKFKYFKKDDKKGQIYNGQFFIAIGS